MTQQQLPRSLRGTIDRVPCPHCGKPQDFRILKDEQLLDTGHQIFCDWCGYSQLVTQIQTITTVAVCKDPSGKRRPVPPSRQLAAQQHQRRQQLGAGGQRPGFFARLLGKG